MSQVHLPHDHAQQAQVMAGKIPDVEAFQSLADIFKQLSDGNRVRIFWLLCHCEACVTNLSAMVQMSSPAVSHHLRQLKTAGLITSRREGKEVYYRAVDTAKSGILHEALEDMMTIACPMEEK